ncbi:MAG: substrate-binding domain-containing protein [Bacteroidetes bacterium]|nr:substrate-binding domain-containing protein [Bacteroidota bacterium]
MKTGKAAKLIFGAAGLIILLFFTSCGGGNQEIQTDNTTSGRIKVAIDESYRLLLDTEIYTFEAIYKGSKFDTIYGNEADIVNFFMKDSVPLMIINRKLSPEEEKYLNARQFIPKTTLIAFDGVVFIVNSENPDTNLFYDKIEGIFKGDVKTWKEISPKSKLGEIKVVFDNYKSSNPRYFREKFNLSKLPSCCFAVNSNAEVISFVENNKNAIGVIGVNWISDREDTISNNFLHRVKVVGLSTPGNNDPDANFYRPYQAYIAQGDYPFTRNVYCINRQTYRGLAYGLSSFIAGEKGQLIVLRSGMVPAAMPVRIVQIKH